MPVARPLRHVLTKVSILGVALAAALGLGGCSSGQWSPTGDAMAGANRRAEYIARAEAPQSGSRSVVLSQDNYGRMASPAMMTNASNTTMTAGVETPQ